MSARAWRTGEPLEAGFERDWREWLARAPFAHFALRPDYLAWTHRLGAPGLAVQGEAAGARGGIAARLERDAWVSGLPWRWQAALAAPGREPGEMLSAGEALELFRHLERFADGRRVCAHLPVPPAGGVPGYLAGKTLLHRITVDDDALLRAMDKTKRSVIRRAQREGYRVVEASTLEEFRAFAGVQRDTDRRHGNSPLDRPEDEPGPGERWREWELPWMWLLLAVRDGEVGSGFGFALGQGEVLESRAAASLAPALKSGAFVLLAFEAARRARERGYRYLNWGGDTFFKRDVSGDLAVRVPLYAWLGGGARWALANRAETLVRSARVGAAGALQALRRRPSGAAGGGTR
jgi:hypothetical protein